MFLKHRNLTAYILLIVSSICFTLGLSLWNSLNSPNQIQETAFFVFVEGTSFSAVADHSEEDRFSVSPTEDNTLWEETEGDVIPGQKKDQSSGKRILGYLLFLAGASFAAAALFVFSQKTPLLGPDGICLLPMGYILLCFAAEQMLSKLPLSSMGYAASFSLSEVLPSFLSALGVFLFLSALRELLGWIRHKFSLSWCLLLRLSQKEGAPQKSLLIFAAGIVFPAVGLTVMLGINSISILLSCFAVQEAFALACLWRYGKDLNHFQEQLELLSGETTISVQDGAFRPAEERLLKVQEENKKAIQTAVTSERFKVELIANVSHDLRTPLTSILGYGELLRSEKLSPEGQEQLLKLNQKAGYMKDLVESLFELTKVSSGVIPCKKEEIDLLRLLEQTIGLFDDQLIQTGLEVRRIYHSKSLPVITDGARMHQVFANLLGNAIKYALKGTRIYLEAAEAEKAILVRMTNTSSYEMDFDPEEILQRFVRGDKARTTRGSGIGLAIAQTYTESVGGSFRINIDGDQFRAIVELPKTERIL